MATESAARFDPDIAPFGAMAPQPVTDGTWADLARLVGRRGTVSLTGDPPTPPRGWTVIATFAGVQMVGNGVHASRDDIQLVARTPDSLPVSPVRLGTADVSEMLALVERTQPGPFLDRTIEFGCYLGIRDRTGHRLVAMAGERMRPPGYVEVSAVTTESGYRRMGFARQLVTAVAGGIVQSGNIPFLHASATNIGAIRLYRSLGFTFRREVEFLLLEAPG
ncbi:MAG: GNAT family N-acetyltransferase [Acidimicrobiales bacterium]